MFVSKTCKRLSKNRNEMQNVVVVVVDDDDDDDAAAAAAAAAGCCCCCCTCRKEDLPIRMSYVTVITFTEIMFRCTAPYTLQSLFSISCLAIALFRKNGPIRYGTHQNGTLFREILKTQHKQRDTTYKSQGGVECRLSPSPSPSFYAGQFA